MIHRKIVKARVAVQQSVAKIFNGNRSKSSEDGQTDTRKNQSSRFLHSPLVLFTREILQNPRAMGAACPSSRKLSQALASFVPLERPGFVVELGAGTGSITAALLAHGVAPERLILVERSPKLVEYLRKQFPQASVVEGDASHLKELLGDKAQHVSVVVSGLPLRAFPVTLVQSILKQIDLLLPKDGLFIQFTYDLRGKMPHLPQHFRTVTHKFVWSNLPPARVDVYRNEKQKKPALSNEPNL